MKAPVAGVHGDHLAGQRFTIGDAPVTFGRGEDNDIVIPDPAVSRVHAELRQEADGFIITDRGSANGTRVNGVVVTGACRLCPGRT
jgi:pSer/pThr/pTyr-binding forkhead associated (FHA) protein